MPELIGGSMDGASVKDVHQSEVLNPVERRDSKGRVIVDRIRRVEVYERNDVGNFEFVKVRMMTPDEEDTQRGD